jgi:hypothetical protein
MNDTNNAEISRYPIYRVVIFSQENWHVEISYYRSRSRTVTSSEKVSCAGQSSDKKTGEVSIRLKHSFTE